MNPDEEVLDDDLGSAVAEQLSTLPKPVQDFIVGPERTRVALALTQKHSLHADQASVFEVQLIHMLLGVSSPEEFTKALTDAGIAPSTVAALATDVNAEVFIPLREAERQSPEAVPAPQKPAPLPPPAIEYQPAPTLPGSPVPAPMPVPVPVPQASVAPPVPVQEVAPVPAPALEPTPPQHIVPQQHFMHAMPNAQPQSGWHPAAAVHIFVPTHTAPHQQPAPVQHAPEPAPPAYAAPAPQAPVAPPAAPEPVTPAVPAVAPQQPSTPLKKEYGADPYREPIQ